MVGIDIQCLVNSYINCLKRLKYYSRFKKTIVKQLNH